MNLLLAEVKVLLGVLAASHLQAPGRRVVEVELVRYNTVIVIVPVALDVVALINVWVGQHRLLDRVHAHIEVFDILRLHVVFN